MFVLSIPQSGDSTPTATAGTRTLCDVGPFLGGVPLKNHQTKSRDRQDEVKLILASACFFSFHVIMVLTILRLAPDPMVSTLRTRQPLRSPDDAIKLVDAGGRWPCAFTGVVVAYKKNKRRKKKKVQCIVRSTSTDLGLGLLLRADLLGKNYALALPRSCGRGLEMPDAWQTPSVNGPCRIDF